MSDVCLSVCLSVAYIGLKSRTERPRKIKIGAEVAHVTRNSDTTFKVKRSKVSLVADVLNSQHAGTGATWRINAKILSTCSGGGILCRHAHSLLTLLCVIVVGRLLNTPCALTVSVYSAVLIVEIWLSCCLDVCLSDCLSVTGRYCV